MKRYPDFIMNVSYSQLERSDFVEMVQTTLEETGFSSLGALKLLRADVVKIDRAFVRNLDRSDADRRVIHSVAGIADTFGARICVEGVETQALWDVLKLDDIDTLQGCFFSRPIRFGEFVSWCEGRD